MDSLLRWAGSKRRIRTTIAALISGSRKSTYVEPFCGSATIFFHVQPAKSILADSNTWLVQTLNTIKRRPKEVYDRLIAMPKTKEIYDNIRSQHFANFDELEASVNFLYLNRLCFNGIYRANSQGLFNVPFSGVKTGDFPTYDRFRDASKILKSAKVVTNDFENTVKKYTKPDTIVYLDPPYATKNSRVFTQYDSHSFGLNDLERLSLSLDLINRRGAHFILSYANVPEVEHLKKQWFSKEISVQRNVSGFSGSRKEAKEILLYNF